MGAQGLVALGILVGAGAAALGIRQYLAFCTWRRGALVRETVENFHKRKAIRNALDILDYEEYKLFEVRLLNGRRVHIEATDARLRRALRSHDQMVKTRRGLAAVTQLSTQNGKVDENTARIFEKYRDEEFVIEITLRNWFDEYLTAFEHYEAMIEAGLATARDFQPYILHEVQIIGDRRHRRTGGSGFYDQLFHYIYWAGYAGVQKLFERYGYKILPPPYSTHDFVNIETPSGKYDAFRALCLAKAAHLVYEDQPYIQDIARYWLSEDEDNKWQSMTDTDYVIDLVKRWLREGEAKSNDAIKENFKYFDMPTTNTQAFLFRKGNHIILTFRGSQQFADWKTNFSFRPGEFKVHGKPKMPIPPGRVHRGFQSAWESVEVGVMYHLRQWWSKDCYFWVTGHSLGGALATLAATSLHYQGFEVRGLYTFGQPRVGDWRFVQAVNAEMGDRIFRYVNNNDIVPMTPPQVSLVNPTWVYGHMGQFRYFNTFGKLQMESFLTQRWLDRLLGMLLALREPGTDFVSDHMMEFYVRHLQRMLDEEKDQIRAQAELEAYEMLELEKTR